MVIKKDKIIIERIVNLENRTCIIKVKFSNNKEIIHYGLNHIIQVNCNLVT